MGVVGSVNYSNGNSGSVMGLLFIALAAAIAYLVWKGQAIEGLNKLWNRLLTLLNFESSSSTTTGSGKVAPFKLNDTGIHHCKTRGGHKDTHFCKEMAKTSCKKFVNGDHVQPCADTLYASCMIPEPIEKESDCWYLAQQECKRGLAQCQERRKECLKSKIDFPDSVQQCRDCGDFKRCVKMREEQCKHQSECWDPFVHFLKENTGTQYAKVWHTLKANGIHTKNALRESTNPMKTSPWFVGKQDSDQHTEMSNIIMKVKDAL
jgi:hypothetical protein